jgi:FSR family fosmidomycin resistance protein-like MFS transporter
VHGITLVFPAVLILLREEFQVSLVELGALGTIQFAFFGLGAIPAGILVDRMGSRLVLSLYFLGLIFSVSILMFADSFFTLALGLGTLGLFSGLYHPAGLNIISHTSHISQNMGYHGISGSIGLTLGPLIGAGMANLAGWRSAYFVLAVVAAVGGLYNHFALPSDKPEYDPREQQKFHLEHVHYLVFGVSAIWGFAHHGLFNYLPLYFSEKIQLGFDSTAEGRALTGGILTAFVLILGIIGQVGGGKLGSVISRKKLLVWVVGLNIPLLILMGFTQGILLVVIVGMLGAVNFSYQPVNNSLIADISSTRNRGLIYGISSGLGFGVGSLAAIAGGYVGEYFQLSYVFPSLGIVLIPAVFLSYLVYRDK